MHYLVPNIQLKQSYIEKIIIIFLTHIATHDPDACDLTAGPTEVVEQDKLKIYNAVNVISAIQTDIQDLYRARSSIIARNNLNSDQLVILSNGLVRSLETLYGIPQKFRGVPLPLTQDNLLEISQMYAGTRKNAQN